MKIDGNIDPKWIKMQDADTTNLSQLSKFHEPRDYWNSEMSKWTFGSIR